MATAYRQNQKTNDKTDCHIVVKKCARKGETETKCKEMKDYSHVVLIQQENASRYFSY